MAKRFARRECTGGLVNFKTNPAILHELIDRIEVHHIVGTGKARVEQIIIYYRFVGSVEIPDAPQASHTADTRQGVSVTYEAIAG